MIHIEIKNEKNLESALKTFKYKVNKTRLIQELKNRQEYVKPSINRRNKKLKAIFMEKNKKDLD